VSVRDLVLLLAAGGFCALGLFMLVAPARFRALHARRKDRELADRQARGTDAWFEEQRTLQAYRQPPRGVRLLGALALLLGGTTIALFATGVGR
jgi:hypothetical protein